MYELIAGAVFIVACATALVAWSSMVADKEFAKWKAEMDRRGIKTALEPVLMGSDIVGYTYVLERRSNRL
jgi:hypothetical protein